jgi:hypothetical protein
VGALDTTWHFRLTLNTRWPNNTFEPTPLGGEQDRADYETKK